MQRGIIIFDETILERLRDIDVVVFDKTGTLTTGQMSVIDAEAPTELLPMAAAMEHRAAHPAARAIAEAYSPANDVDSVVEIQEFVTHSKGVGGLVDGRKVLVGHPDLFEAQRWEVAADLQARVQEERRMGRLPVLVGRSGQAEGVIVIGDEPRNDWDSTIARLSERGIDIVVLTGDDEEAAEFLRQDPHVDRQLARRRPFADYKLISTWRWSATARTTPPRSPRPTSVLRSVAEPLSPRTQQTSQS
jgi:P-type E1-E2 ATPase